MNQVVAVQDLIAALTDFRNHPEKKFDRLMDVTAVDRDGKFDVVYRLHSLQFNHDAVVTTSVPHSDPSLPTASGIWDSALFGEREVRDMFGIKFEGHPDFRPLLVLEEGLDFFPLRKDFKLPVREVSR